MPTTLYSEKFPQIQTTNLNAASGVVFATIVGVLSGSTFARVDNLLVCNTDVIDHKVQFAIVNGGNTFNIGSIDVPAGTGTGGTPAVDAIPLLISTGNLGLMHVNEGNIQAKVEVAIGSGQVSIVAYYGIL